MTALDSLPAMTSPPAASRWPRPTLAWIVVAVGCASVSGSIAAVDEIAGWIGR